MGSCASTTTHRGGATLPSVTGLRFLAVLLVFAFHGTLLSLFASARISHAYSFAAGNAAACGVSFFFVLSGFVLTWSARDGERARTFYRRRFVRIVPSHLVAWAIALGGLVAGGLGVAVLPALANLLLQAWVPQERFALRGANAVAWSLSVEAFFYLTFPLWSPLLDRVRPERLPVLWVVAVVAALWVPVVIGQLLPGGRASVFSSQTSWAVTWLVYFFPPTRLLEFLAGVLLARSVMAGRWFRVGVPTAVLVLAAVYAASLWSPDVVTFAAVYPAPVSLLIGAVVTSDLSRRATFASSRAMVRLGELSYAFFLVYLTVLFSLNATLGRSVDSTGAFVTAYSPWVASMILLGGLLLSLAVARMLHRWVEVPAVHRWSRPAPPADRPAAQLPTPAEPVTAGPETQTAKFLRENTEVPAPATTLTTGERHGHEPDDSHRPRPGRRGGGHRGGSGGPAADRPTDRSATQR